MLFNRYIRKYFFKYFYLLIIGIIALLAVDYFQLVIPESLGKIIDMFDNGSVAGNEEEIIKIVVNVLIVAVILFVGRITFRLTLSRNSTNIEAGLRREMFIKAEKMSSEYYHKTKVGNIMNWFSTDIETVEEFLRWGIIMAIDAIFLGVLALYKMFTLNRFVALITLLPLGLIIVWGAIVENVMDKKWNERQQAVDQLYYFSQESFTGIRVIKAFVKETQQIHEFAKVAKKNADVNVNFTRISVILDVVIEVIISLIITLILGIGTFLVINTFAETPFEFANRQISMSPGELTTFVGYFSTLVWPMMALGQIFSFYSRARASMKRISNFLNENVEIHDDEDAVNLVNASGKIEFRDLSFAYESAKEQTLKHINLTINPGEIIGIVGRIGCGKTTLVSLLLRFYNIKEGSLFIDGKDIMKIKLDDLRKNVSMANQDTFLFSDEIQNNISFGNKFDMEKIKEAADFADITKDIDTFADGFETVSGERGVTLSGGQKQRISIARAYYRDAPIMILDDSVSAVDTKTSEAILANIKSKRAGKTTIIISSRVSTVADLDKIILLDDGEVKGFDSPQNLLKNNELYRKMVELQRLEDEVNG